LDGKALERVAGVPYFAGVFRTPRRWFLAACAGVILPAGLVVPGFARENVMEVTTVRATVHNGYERTKEADGSFKFETYTFGEGGFNGTPTKDKSLDELSFRQVAGLIAPGLAHQGYLASFDAEQTQLLVLVYWGTTGTDQSAADGYDPGPGAITPPPPPPMPTGGPGGLVNSAPPPLVPMVGSQQAAYDAMTSARNRTRDRANFRNAQILGYDEALEKTSAHPDSRSYLDIVKEIEDTRYFVVLRAYDFQQMWKEKKMRLLWEVHYSLRARDHRFDESLSAMTEMACRYFGQASKGLVRKEVPVGEVRLGDTIYQGETKPAPAGKK
jgi:hypothetical protein